MIPLFLSIRLEHINQRGGERVVGDEGGAEACNREKADIVQCSHGAENEDEEHGVENECGHAHSLADFAVREQ